VLSKEYVRYEFAVQLHSKTHHIKGMALMHRLAHRGYSFNTVISYDDPSSMDNNNNTF